FFIHASITAFIFTLSLHDALPILGALALSTTILLGACGNDDMKKDDMMMSGMFKSMNGEMVEDKATIKDHKLMLTDYKSSKGPRSEEHTSELQSRFDLVCRLLLEK